MKPITVEKYSRGPGMAGFTLIEVMIALAVFSVVVGVAVKYFSTQQSTLTKVDQRSQMTINARGGMYLIESHIRLMGFCPGDDLRADGAMDHDQGCRAGPGQLVFRRKNPDDISETQTISIELNQSDDREGGVRDGFVDNHGAAGGLNIQGGRVVENVKAIRFAYGFDADGDGHLDLSPNNNIIWAFDANGDGRLDTLLDTNDDGLINQYDASGGAAMGKSVDISAVRAVKVWLLVRSPNPLRGGGVDNHTYYVGGQAYKPGNSYGHMLYTTTIRCRNMFGG